MSAYSLKNPFGFPEPHYATPMMPRQNSSRTIYVNGWRPQHPARVQKAIQQRLDNHHHYGK